MTLSYTINQNLGQNGVDPGGDHSAAGFSIAGINASASTVLLFETQGTTLPDITAYQEGATLCTNGQSGIGNGSSYIFDKQCGGHVGRYATGDIGGLLTGPGNAANTDIMIPSKVGIHSEGANYLAVDGHVKWLRPSAVSAGSNATTANDPQNTPGSQATGTDSMKIGGATANMTFSTL